MTKPVEPSAPRRKSKRYIKVSFCDWPREFGCEMCGTIYRRATSFHIVLDFRHGMFIFGKPLKRNNGVLRLEDKLKRDFVRVSGWVCRTCAMTITDRIDRQLESRVR